MNVVHAVNFIVGGGKEKEGSLTEGKEEMKRQTPREFVVRLQLRHDSIGSNGEEGGGKEKKKRTLLMTQR